MVTLSPIPLLTMRLVMSRKTTTAIMVARVQSHDSGVISSTTFQVGGISCGALEVSSISSAVLITSLNTRA